MSDLRSWFKRVLWARQKLEGDLGGRVPARAAKAQECTPRLNVCGREQLVLPPSVRQACAHPSVCADRLASGPGSPKSRFPPRYFRRNKKKEKLLFLLLPLPHRRCVVLPRTQEGSSLGLMTLRQACRQVGAICVQRFDDSLVLQFTLRIAACCVLHRCTSQEIHR